MDQDYSDRKEAGIEQGLESITYPGVCFRYPNWSLRERGQASGRQKGMRIGRSLYVFSLYVGTGWSRKTSAWGQ